MRKFSAEELSAFLSAVDDHLDHHVKIVVLGGGALALAYDDDYRTQDIDLSTTPTRSLLAACEAARDATGLDVPLSKSGVAEGPYNSDDRLTRIFPDFQNLEVLVFDEYDVVLSKIIRGGHKDVDAIRRLHRKRPLDEDVLVNRYLSEMDHITGNLRAVDQYFVSLIGTLYGDAEAERVEEMLPYRSPSGERRSGKRRPRR